MRGGSKTSKGLHGQAQLTLGTGKGPTAPDVQRMSMGKKGGKKNIFLARLCRVPPPQKKKKERRRSPCQPRNRPETPGALLKATPNRPSASLGISKSPAVLGKNPPEDGAGAGPSRVGDFLGDLFCAFLGDSRTRLARSPPPPTPCPRWISKALAAARPSRSIDPSDDVTGKSDSNQRSPGQILAAKSANSHLVLLPSEPLHEPIDCLMGGFSPRSQCCACQGTPCESARILGQCSGLGHTS